VTSPPSPTTKAEAERSSSSPQLRRVVAIGAAIADESLARLVITYEATTWILRRDEIGYHSATIRNSKPRSSFAASSRQCVERLSELERDSRRKDGPALFDDLSSLRAKTPPFDLASLKVPTVYVYGDSRAPDFYGSSAPNWRRSIHSSEVDGHERRSRCAPSIPINSPH